MTMLKKSSVALVSRQAERRIGCVVAGIHKCGLGNQCCSDEVFIKAYRRIAWHRLI
jgi:hypothetical protein